MVFLFSAINKRSSSDRNQEEGRKAKELPKAIGEDRGTKSMIARLVKWGPMAENTQKGQRVMDRR